MKKTWIKPQLIVLVRGTAEEAVLIACKSGTTGPALGGSSPSTSDTGCSSLRSSPALDYPSLCVLCEALVAS